MRASALLYLFRALASSEDADIESQVLRIVEEIIPCGGGFLILARNEEDLMSVARDRELDDITTRVIREGAMHHEGTLIAPLYVHQSIAGVLAVNAAPEHMDNLTAIATIASTALESARDIAVLEVRNVLLKQAIDTGIVGDSAAWKRVLQMAERVAPQDTTVLILGESGTGKELIARTLHDKSKRKNGAFVAINCAALTETLLESELFGHEKGAFTGAATLKKGKLEMADGGTVFLDEIGEMAGGLQAKLLRVLQQREFERVGGTRTQHLNVRMIAATNRDLAAEVKAGHFREDLYHRLNVIALRTPPLRDRKEDIPPLAAHFLSRASARCGRRVTRIAPEAIRMLMAYSWPGNVRELENAIERAVVLGDDEVLLPEDLPESVAEPLSFAPELAGSYYSSVGDAKKDAVMRAWLDAKGDYKEAARSLSLHPNSLLRLIRNLGMREELERAAKA